MRAGALGGDTVRPVCGGHCRPDPLTSNMLWLLWALAQARLREEVRGLMLLGSQSKQALPKWVTSQPGS